MQSQPGVIINNSLLSPEARDADAEWNVASVCATAMGLSRACVVRDTGSILASCHTSGQKRGGRVKSAQSFFASSCLGVLKLDGMLEGWEGKVRH